MKKLLLALCIFSGFTLCEATAKLYLDEACLDSCEDAFYIHTGNNSWLVSETMHTDEKGLYAYENELFKEDMEAVYKKTWKCPYCFAYYEIGKACSNSACPSKYKN